MKIFVHDLSVSLSRVNYVSVATNYFVEKLWSRDYDSISR